MAFATLSPAQYAPDVASVDVGASDGIMNVLPIGSGYRPMPGPATYSTSALDEYARGIAALADTSGAGKNFAGDRTKLYLMDSNSSWADVTNVGGAYALGAEDFWDFALFGSNVIATSPIEPPQIYTIGSSSNFADLSGSPSQAMVTAVVRDQLWLGNLDGDNQSVQWSDTNDVTDWSSGLADSQSFPDGGAVQRIIGGEYALVFQKETIRRGTFVGGKVVYRFDEIGTNRGLLTPRAIARRGWDIWFLDADGFYYLNANSGEFRPIGAERVNRTFFADLNDQYLHRITAEVDPSNQLVFFSYPSNESTDGEPDKILAYDYSQDRWTPAEVGVQLIGRFKSLSTTWDNLDNIYSTIDDVDLAFDSKVFVGGVLSFVGFNASNQMQTFNGDCLAATITTEEAEPLKGGRVFVDNTIPLIDTSSATVSLGARERVSDALTYTAETSMEADGTCPAMASGRSMVGRVSVPAATTWSKYTGIRVDGEPDGET